MQKYREAPIYFCDDVLGVKPWEIQKQIFESVRDNKRTAVRSCHGPGKSWTAARIALWYLCAHPFAIVATTAPTFRQVEKILWQEIRRAHTDTKREIGGNLLTTELRFTDGWYAFGLATNDPDAFQGLHSARGNVLIIFDEASGIEPAIWTSAEGCLTGANCRFLAIGNPTNPVGDFFKECTSADTKQFKISAFDTPNFTAFGITQSDIATNNWQSKITSALPMPELITPEWVADKYKRWGPTSPAYLSRVLADFPQSAEDSLILLHLIEAAQARTLEKTEPHELAVDVARFGGDKTIIGERWGSVVHIRSKYSKQDTMETAGRVVKALVDSGANKAKVDVIGVGSGVVDRLNECRADTKMRGKTIEACNAGSAPRDKSRFLNARAEWFWNIRERAEEGDLDLDDDPELAAQLSGIKYKLDSRGRILIESKEDMKKRGMKSPDEADMVAIALSESGYKEVDMSDTMDELSCESSFSV